MHRLTHSAAPTDHGSTNSPEQQYQQPGNTSTNSRYLPFLMAVLLASTLPGSCAGDDEYLDLFPPPADRAVEPVRSWSCCCLDESFEDLLGCGGILQRAGAEKVPELSLTFQTD